MTNDNPNERELAKAFVINRMFYLFLALCVLATVAALPSVAERIAYSSARGQERAKREEAMQFLKDFPAASYDKLIPYVAKIAAPSVVGIKTNTIQAGYYGDSIVAQGQGSGVIVSSDGMIITNFHVICENNRLVDGVEIILSDGRAISDGVRLIGFDENLDVAVLQIQATQLTPIEWGDSDQLEVGDHVLALGNPYGLAKTVTEGIISAKERFVFNDVGVATQEFLQTDAAVNPGNSGGALVDDHGRLVGINTAIYGQQYQGISFALPVNRVREVYQRILSQDAY